MPEVKLYMKTESMGAVGVRQVIMLTAATDTKSRLQHRSSGDEALAGLMPDKEKFWLSLTQWVFLASDMKLRTLPLSAGLGHARERDIQR